MPYRALADLVAVAHLGFILFVVFGGLPVLRWPRVAWLHAPAALWGAAISLGGWICPLTPLENALRRSAGEAGYAGGFIERYVLPVIYPGALTREIQILMGVAVVAVNVLVYLLLYRSVRQRRARSPER